MEFPVASNLQAKTSAVAPQASTHVTNPAPTSHAGRVATDVSDGLNTNATNHANSQHDRELNNSQESVVSSLSSTSKKPPSLFPSSSNVSTATVHTVDTDLTPPGSREQLNSLAQKAIEIQQSLVPRPNTPGSSNGSKDAGSDPISSASTSPMSVDTPFNGSKGTKRTASGAVKSMMSVQTAVPVSHAMVPAEERSPKELAKALKTRLSYAMYKVQHGLERHNLDELEAMTERSMPSTPARSRASTTATRRLSMFSETGSEPYLHSPVSSEFPIETPRLLQDLASIDYKSSTKAPLGRTTNGPSLQPAAPISGRSSRRSVSSKAPPMFSMAGIPRSTGDYPTTPQRQGILRMPSKQAEKDAVDTLIFMSSPNNSNNMKYSSSNQASPLRSEFGSQIDNTGAATGKRVAFDGGMVEHVPR